MKVAHIAVKPLLDLLRKFFQVNTLTNKKSLSVKDYSETK